MSDQSEDFEVEKMTVTAIDLKRCLESAVNLTKLFQLLEPSWKSLLKTKSSKNVLKVASVGYLIAALLRISSEDLLNAMDVSLSIEDQGDLDKIQNILDEMNFDEELMDIVCSELGDATISDNFNSRLGMVVLKIQTMLCNAFPEMASRDETISATSTEKGSYSNLSLKANMSKYNVH
jgi:hypothetical protein